jgi:dolichyl-phosphate beta-glucosyltransferase
VFLEANGLEGEIIVVDDGSGDNTAETAQKAVTSCGMPLKVLRYELHRGKGRAVRTGMKESVGEYVMFADSGCCVPYGNALQGLYMLRSRTCDIAHGSRKLLESHIRQAQPWRRRVSARLFRWLISKVLALPPGITDSQCGFKMYRGDVARKLYGECISDGFMFDVEIILRAKEQGYRIKEFPIEWTCDIDSRLSLPCTMWPILSELIAIRHALSKK